MPRLKEKRPNQGVYVWADFRGGVNLAEEPELMADNQISLGRNVEFSPGSGLLKTRRVLTEKDSLTVHPQTLHVMGGSEETLLASFMPSTTQKLYRYNSGGLAKDLGALTGGDLPCYASWSDDQVLVASGGKLQKFDRSGDTLSTIAASPDCDTVIVKEGRVGVAKSGSDRITWSGIGDCDNWQSEDEGAEDDIDYHTDDDSQWLEVGYKDGCKIVAMAMLGQDLIVFKSGYPQTSEGKIYRVSGDFPHWEVTEISRTSRLRNRYSVVPIGGDVVYIDDTGVQVLSQLVSQGDLRGGLFSSADAGLNSYLDDTCRMWRLSGENKIIIRPSMSTVEGIGIGSDPLWVIDAELQTWTTWTFPGDLNVVSSGAAPSYLSFGTSVKIYSLGSSGARDRWEGTYREVLASVGCKAYTPVRDFCITRFLLRCGNHSIEDVTASVTVAELQRSETVEYENVDARLVEWCNLLADEIAPRVDITGGNVIIRAVKVEWEEVG